MKYLLLIALIYTTGCAVDNTSLQSEATAAMLRFQGRVTQGQQEAQRRLDAYFKAQKQRDEIIANTVKATKASLDTAVNWADTGLKTSLGGMLFGGGAFGYNRFKKGKNGDG